MKKQTNKQKSSSKVGLIPLGDRLLIKEASDSESKTSSGIYLPESAKEDRGSKVGVVIAMGEGRCDDGKLIPMKVKVGDKVLFQWGDKVSHSGEEYMLVREGEVIAIIK